MFSVDTRCANTVVTVAVLLSVLLGVFLGVNRDRMPNGLDEFLAIRITIKNLVVTAIFLLVSSVAIRIFGLVSPPSTLSLWRELVKATKACTVVTASTLLFLLTSSGGAFTGRIVFFFLPLAIVTCVSGRIVAYACARWLTRTLSNSHDLIIVGSGPRAANLYKCILEPGDSNCRVLGFVDSPNSHEVTNTIQRQMLGGLEQLEEILMKQPVDEVLIALPAKSCYTEIQTAIATCERAGIEAKYLSDFFEVSLARPRFELDEKSSMVSLKVVHDDYRLLVKRCVDIVGAISGLAFLGPLMLLIATLIKVTHPPGPVFFTQKRYGLRKRLFRMYKFRTMTPGAEGLQASLESQNEATGPVFKIHNDPRITSLGRILRRTSIDELPQLVNVLRGEMSLVGPRPLPLRDVSRFDASSLMRRFSVKPGLTCLWQVSGRSDTTFSDWIEQDLHYIDNWSLALDFKILVKTVPVVLKGTGAV